MYCTQLFCPKHSSCQQELNSPALSITIIAPPLLLPIVHQWGQQLVLMVSLILILPFCKGHSEDNRVLQPVEDVIHHHTPPLAFHLSCLVAIGFLP